MMELMVRVPFELVDFPLSFPQVGSSLITNASQFLGHAAQVGSASFFGGTRRGAVRTRADTAWRMGSLRAHLRFTSMGISKNSTYTDELDPSEKAFISYMLGSTIASLMATELLAASGVAHVDRVLKLLGLPLPRERRPDFLGYTGHAPHLSSGASRIIIEAKGSSSGFQQRQLDSALGQLGKSATSSKLEPSILQLLGPNPFKIASLAYFSKVSKQLPTPPILQCHFEDPPSVSSVSSEYSASEYEGAVLAAQLVPLAQLIQPSPLGPAIPGYKIAALQDVGVFFVIPDEIERLAQQWLEIAGRRDPARRLASDTLEVIQDLSTRDIPQRLSAADENSSMLPSGIMVYIEPDQE